MPCNATCNATVVFPPHIYSIHPLISLVSVCRGSSLASAQSDKLKLIPSRRTKIPGFDFSVILGCAKYTMIESVSDCIPDLTVSFLLSSCWLV